MLRKRRADMSLVCLKNRQHGEAQQFIAWSQLSILASFSVNQTGPFAGRAIISMLTRWEEIADYFTSNSHAKGDNYSIADARIFTIWKYTADAQSIITSTIGRLSIENWLATATYRWQTNALAEIYANISIFWRFYSNFACPWPSQLAFASPLDWPRPIFIANVAAVYVNQNRFQSMMPSLRDDEIIIKRRQTWLYYISEELVGGQQCPWGRAYRAFQQVGMRAAKMKDDAEIPVSWKAENEYRKIDVSKCRWEEYLSLEYSASQRRNYPPLFWRRHAARSAATACFAYDNRHRPAREIKAHRRRGMRGIDIGVMSTAIGLIAMILPAASMTRWRADNMAMAIIISRNGMPLKY